MPHVTGTTGLPSDQVTRTFDPGRRSVAPILASAAAFAMIGIPVAAEAAIIGPYRLAFVTSSTTNAESGSLDAYDSFVSGVAGGNTSLPSTMWYAIASVDGVNAIDHITDCSGCDGSTPIYLVDGTLLAGSVSALFNPSLMESTFDRDEFGDSVESTYVWTGSTEDGAAAVGNELGSSFPTFGYTPDLYYTFNMAGYTDSNSATYPLYGISAVINAPEPASVSLLAAGGLLVAAVRRRRRR